MITRESTCCGCRQSMMNLNYRPNCAPLAFQVGGNRDQKKKNEKPLSSPSSPSHPGGSQATAVSSRWRRKYQLWHDVAVEPPLQHKRTIDCGLLLVWTTTTTKKRGTGYYIKSGCCLVVTHARLCWDFTQRFEFYHDRSGRCSYDEREIEIDFWRILLRSRLWLLLPLFFKR